MDQSFDEYEVCKQVIGRIRIERPAPVGAAHIATDAIAPALTPKQLSDLRSIDFSADIPNLRDWFRELLANEPPSEDIRAFYFGLFDEVVGLLKKKDAPAMYACGSDRFDAADPYCEWACGPTWFPNRRYPRVNAFRRLATAVPQTGVLAAIVADAFVFALAEDLVTHTDSALVLGDRPWRAVATGYDSGDPYLVGYITPEGFSIKHPAY